MNYLSKDFLNTMEKSEMVHKTSNDLKITKNFSRISLVKNLSFWSEQSLISHFRQLKLESPDFFLLKL